MDEEIIFKPIGYIKSPYKDVGNMPKAERESGDIVAEMVINEEYLESMSSMEVGERYMVLFYFHKSKGFEQRVPFRGVGPIKGLFSTHAPNRPNPIGVSTIRIEEINGNVIKFSGVDMLNGTPVLDIKDIL
ncbi:tRNA (N6-threonylcarbamoyladenosine(37)-N6)-methyltransferase TrmO [Methanobrevibacter sp.]|uniref:tRNA (N6-threonylcarbamoyladenosine(37)-N6)-methyltransferase TrmO n=1 Tax=Methanobrevibacter sp. TaxID=66852 RepID=UPI0025CC2A23|nr:tRNA (N6-threonylcarbamoyladenosine(37)-N6)-methyltransferase TrmO [Methanobrevibacter sp.]MBQ2961341.1 tRNA (N6-threonylcarbamoyladenosine(37)-N6)-methyltransferase TrmO [Methanobrevibacter sp.]